MSRLLFASVLLQQRNENNLTKNFCCWITFLSVQHPVNTLYLYFPLFLEPLQLYVAFLRSIYKSAFSQNWLIFLYLFYSDFPGCCSFLVPTFLTLVGVRLIRLWEVGLGRLPLELLSPTQDGAPQSPCRLLQPLPPHLPLCRHLRRHHRCWQPRLVRRQWPSPYGRALFETYKGETNKLSL